jgi:hypothetical protein
MQTLPEIELVSLWATWLSKPCWWSSGEGETRQARGPGSPTASPARSLRCVFHAESPAEAQALCGELAPRTGATSIGPSKSADPVA